MGSASSHRLRAFILIMALAFGLAGQSFAPAAMAMSPATTPVVTADMVGASMSPSESCLGCAGIDHSKAMLSDCSVGLCSGVVAILPAANKTVATHAVVAFVSVTERAGQGITIPPALGPPRFLHFT